MTMTTLSPMQADTFAAYLDTAIAGYARENVAAGRWPSGGAEIRSREDFAQLLPQGLATPDNFFYDIVAGTGGAVVGHVWFAIERRLQAVFVFVFDIEIAPAHRRKGHATRALAQIETIALALGATRIGLNVFTHNAGARALYSALGYESTNCNLLKHLGK